MEHRPWSETPRQTCHVCDAEMIEALSYTRAKGRLTEPQEHVWFKVEIPSCSRCQPSWSWSGKVRRKLYVPNSIYNKVASAGLAGRTAGAKMTVTNSNMKLAAGACPSARDLTREGAWTAAVQMLLPQIIAASSHTPMRKSCCSLGCMWMVPDGMELISYGWEMILPPGSPAQPKGGDAGPPMPSSDTPTTSRDPSTTHEDTRTSAGNPAAGGSFAAALAEVEKDSSTRVSATRALHSEGSCQNGASVPVGVKILPTLMDKKYFSSIRKNVKRGLKERVEDKEVPMTVTDSDVKEIQRMVRALQSQAFTEDKIRHVASSILFGDLKSKKWSAQRVEAGLRFLHERYSPEMQFTVSVKLEPMPHNKPPRVLIADGDAGQIKSWLCIGILERLLFYHFSDNSIKSGSKAEAMGKHESDMRITKAAVSILENDGSAWDACCRKRLRELTEVPIIEHIIKVLDEMMIPENEWSHQRLRADKKTFLKLRFAPKIELTHPSGSEEYDLEEIECAAMNKPIFFKIDAIRRSGDRGTSCLNFLMNVVCWAWVLCGSSCALMVKGRTTRIPLWNGGQSTVKIKCEGDDSHLAVTYKFSQDELDDLESRWTRLGHRPKLYLRQPGSVTEFTGYHFLVDEHGIIPGTGCPDIVRTMVASSVTIAKEAVAGVVEEDEKKIAPIACASLLCTAAAFSERLPSLANFYLRVSREWMARGHLKHVELTHDHIMRLTPEVKDELFPEPWKGKDATEAILKAGSKIGDIVTVVEGRIAQCDLEAEARHVEQKGVCSAGIWEDIIKFHMDVTIDTDEQVYRQGLRTLCGFDKVQGT